MSEKKSSKRRFFAGILFLAGLAVLAGAGIVVYRFAAAQGTGLRSTPTAVLSIARAVTASQTVKEASTGQYTNIIFLHHSTGRNLIDQGHLRELLTAQGYQFWDQDYNDPGLRNPQGEFTGYAYSVPNDNTDPDGLAVIFAQTPQSAPVNTLSGLLQHEVILFKSCFPNSNIDSQEKLDSLKKIYLGIRDTVDRHPDKVFLLLTTPPLNPAETNADNARRAREMANWLASDEFTGGRKNLFIFNFYEQLARANDGSAEANMLRADYREGSDSHPNQKANETIAPLLAEFIAASINAYRTQ